MARPTAASRVPLPCCGPTRHPHRTHAWIRHVRFLARIRKAGPPAPDPYPLRWCGAELGRRHLPLSSPRSSVEPGRTRSRGSEPAEAAEMSAGLVTDEATMGRLYRIRRTVMQMLRDRGYLVGEHELATSRRDFLRKFGESFHREDLLINKYKKNDPSDQIYVFFPNDDKVGMKHIKKYVEMMTHENVSRAVLVLQQNLTPYQTASKNTDYGSHCKVLWPQTRSGSEDHQTQ